MFADYECRECHYTVIDVWMPRHGTSKYGVPKCPDCDVNMTLKAAAPSFKVKGYNARNGYSKKEG